MRDIADIQKDIDKRNQELQKIKDEIQLVESQIETKSKEENKEIKVAEPKQKIQVDLEVDTSIKDLGVNPYAKIIHLAKAIDAWRIFPRVFITTYIYLLYKVVIWYMNIADPTLEQSGLVSIVVGAGAAWFGLYTGTSKK